ncbi:hypothetical protein ES705_17400 [subsurface metagenome]
MKIGKDVDISKIHPEINKRLDVIEAVIRAHGVVPELFNFGALYDEDDPADGDVAISWDDFTLAKGREVCDALERALGPGFGTFNDVDEMFLYYDPK